MSRRTKSEASTRGALVAPCGVAGALLLGWLAAMGLSCSQGPGGRSAAPAVERPPQRVCLSLSALAREANAARLAGRSLPGEWASLGGISRAEGLVVDSENADVILVGTQVSSRPALTLDDLVVNLRSVWTPGPPPYCSLDPEPQDVIRVQSLLGSIGTARSTEEMRSLVDRLRRSVGGQRVVVGGVPRNSRFAHVMIDADYHMKRLSQGLAAAPGILSTLDHSLNGMLAAARAGQPMPAQGLTRSRFWFHVRRGSPTFRESAGIVWLDSCPVIVLTERQMATADGRLHDAGGDDPSAQAFAASLSDGFGRAAQAYPIYADLENLFHLSALVRALRLRNPSALAAPDLNFYLRDYRYVRETPMPDSFPGLANSKEGQTTNGDTTYTFMPVVAGGVSMEMPVDARQFTADPAGQLTSLRTTVLSARPARSTVLWTLRAF